MSADHPMPLRTDRVLDLRSPWKLPQNAHQWQEQMDFDADVRALLQHAADKAGPRRFAAAPEPITGFGPLED